MVPDRFGAYPGGARSNGCCHRGVSELLARVADQVLRANAFGCGDALDQEPRSGPRLSIDKAKPLAGDIPKITHSCGIAARKQQSLLAIDEADQAVASQLKPAAEGSDLSGFAGT